MQAYEHRQFSPWPLAVAGLYGLTVAARKASKRKRRRPNAASVGLALCTLAFCVLNTRVDESGVFWSFGFGFPSGSIPLEILRTPSSRKPNFGKVSASIGRPRTAGSGTPPVTTP
jgi:hypothetical protein